MTWQAESFVPFGSLCLPLPVLSPSSLMINPIRKLEYAATKERPPPSSDSQQPTSRVKIRAQRREEPSRAATASR
jgi:hypothetical protein